MNTRRLCAAVIIALSVMFSACAPSTPLPLETDSSAGGGPSGQPTEEIVLPLSAHGPYIVGIKRNIAFVDAGREDRKVTLTIWYPAETPASSEGAEPFADAVADKSKAPYPVILASSKVGFMFAKQIASHGFVFIGINGLETYRNMTRVMIDQPLDIIFALDQVSKNPVEGLEGIVDTDHAGAMGYSFDGTNDIFLSGARVDPAYYLDYCQKASVTQPPLADWYLSFYCELSKDWATFEASVGPEITESDDGLWQAITDPRIKAVMPMAPDGAWLFGEKGLSYADRAVLMIQAGLDSTYQPTEGKFMFENLGSKDKSMVSFLGQEHMMVYDPVQVARMVHFAVAFFGVQLQGKQELAEYYSESYLAGFEDLAWGFKNE